MKIKNRELESYLKTFYKLSNIEFSGRKGYEIYKFISKLSNELNSLNKYRVSIEKDYFEFGDDGRIISDNNNPKIKDGKNIEDYILKINDILNADSDIDTNEIEIEENNISNIDMSLSAADWSILDKFIKYKEN